MKRAAGFCCVLVGCAQLTGVSDLEIGEKQPPRMATQPDAEAESGPAPGPTDAGTTPTDAASDTSSPPVDAGTDTGPTTCTTLPTAESFPAAIGAEWTLAGSAVAANPGVTVTPSAASQAGTIWWS